MKIRVLHAETQAEIKQLNLSHVLRTEGSCFIGRSQASGLSLNSSSVSRLHGKFSYHDRQYYFCDLGSSNGSFIQGEMAVANREYLLQPGQVIRLGDFVLFLEAAPELPEQLPETVIGNLDATVISADTYLTAETPVEILTEATCIDENNEDGQQQVIEAELIKESSALVKLTPIAANYSLQTQTMALFTAIHQRVLSELKAAGNLSRDTYLKAICKARESIEQERLIDPEQFEKEAEKHWQLLAKTTSSLGAQIGLATAKGASNLGQRLKAATKAAWSEFLTHRSTTEQAEAAQQSNFDSPDGLPENFDRPSDNLLNKTSLGSSDSDASD